MGTTTELIKQYYDHENVDYAYLLNGKWGVGKTYYVKNTLRKNNIGPNIVYVSLFNVATWKDIVTTLFHELFPDTKKLKPIIKSIISNLLDQKVKYAYSLISALIDHYLEDELVKKLQNKLVVFDDLERTQIPIENLMGNINDVLLSNNIHVLIVGDDSHIKDDKKKVFDKWKEKIIRRTLSLEDGDDEALYNIIQNRQDTSSTSFNIYLNKKEDFKKIVCNVKVDNLRTWQFAFDLIDELFNNYHSDYYFYIEVLQLIVISIQYCNDSSDKTGGSFEKFLIERGLEIDSMQWGSEFRNKYKLTPRIPYVKSLIDYINGQNIDVKRVYDDIIKIYPYLQGIEFINASLINYEKMSKEELKMLLERTIEILNSGVNQEIIELIKLISNIEYLIDNGYESIFNVINEIHDKCIELLKHGAFIGTLDDFYLKKLKNNEELNFLVDRLTKNSHDNSFRRFLDYDNLNDFINDIRYDKNKFVEDLSHNKDEIYGVLTTINHTQAWMFYHFIQIYYFSGEILEESNNQIKEVVNKVINNNAVENIIKIPLKRINDLIC